MRYAQTELDRSTEHVKNTNIFEPAATTARPRADRVPTMKGKRAAWEWINNEMNVPVTMNFVVVNANSKAIPRTKIGAALYFSTQDLYDFVMKRVVEQTEGIHADSI